MNNKTIDKQTMIGIFAGTGAYILWGFLPIYWKYLNHVPPMEILAHRIIWSLLFMFIVIFIMKKGSELLLDIRYLGSHPKIIFGLLLASLFISTNWLLYIWAVANDRIIEASLGYYINPLVSVFLGVVFLKEKVNVWQKISFALATAGVLILTFSFEGIPTIAILLALSFAFYGLVKKLTQIGAFTGLTLETLLLTPVAMIYLFFQHDYLQSAFYTTEQPSSVLFLVGAGAVTAVPLLLFGIGAKKIPLSMIGILQYIAPTIMLFLGVFSYQETFQSVHFVAFSIIWIALLLYSFSNAKWLNRTKKQDHIRRFDS
ncbi:EamA family transporter RarD [Alteribacter aurantiacus]|uniref:EamA family transporter RarD n=1 Tax=Alteribacter aurantiacus TaxID=254410 RepID=UPI00042A54C7|nr:EamA family transporter RarD [Alteribacter aurantiacus]